MKLTIEIDLEKVVALHVETTSRSNLVLDAIDNAVREYLEHAKSANSPDGGYIAANHVSIGAFTVI